MISIIVCTYNRERFLPETLRRLAAQTFDQPWELILVDNASTDSTPRIWQSWFLTCAERSRSSLSKDAPCSARYIFEPTAGLSHARNRGMREARGDWFVFLDDDSFVSPDYVSRLDAYIRSIPDMDAFGGRIYPLFEPAESSALSESPFPIAQADGGRAGVRGCPPWFSRWNRTWVSAIDLGDAVRLFRGKEYPIGANMGVSRRMAQAVGDFNPNLGRTGSNLMAGEEKDFFRRITERGGHIYYLPDIALQHVIPPSRTSLDFIRRYADGVGASERLRTRANHTYARRLCAEAVKWAATILLFAYYTLTCRFPIAQSLLIFRYHVTKNLI